MSAATSAQLQQFHSPSHEGRPHITQTLPNNQTLAAAIDAIQLLQSQLNHGARQPRGQSQSSQSQPSQPPVATSKRPAHMNGTSSNGRSSGKKNRRGANAPTSPIGHQVEQHVTDDVQARYPTLFGVQPRIIPPSTNTVTSVPTAQMKPHQQLTFSDEGRTELPSSSSTISSPSLPHSVRFNHVTPAAHSNSFSPSKTSATAAIPSMSSPQLRTQFQRVIQENEDSLVYDQQNTSSTSSSSHRSHTNPNGALETSRPSRRSPTRSHDDEEDEAEEEVEDDIRPQSIQQHQPTQMNDFNNSIESHHSDTRTSTSSIESMEEEVSSPVRSRANSTSPSSSHHSHSHSPQNHKSTPDETTPGAPYQNGGTRIHQAISPFTTSPALEFSTLHSEQSDMLANLKEENYRLQEVLRKIHTQITDDTGVSESSKIAALLHENELDRAQFEQLLSQSTSQLEGISARHTELLARFNDEVAARQELTRRLRQEQQATVQRLTQMKKKEKEWQARLEELVTKLKSASSTHHTASPTSPTAEGEQHSSPSSRRRLNDLKERDRLMSRISALQEECAHFQARYDQLQQEQIELAEEQLQAHIAPLLKERDSLGHELALAQRRHHECQQFIHLLTQNLEESTQTKEVLAKEVEEVTKRKDILTQELDEVYSKKSSVLEELEDTRIKQRQAELTANKIWKEKEIMIDELKKSQKKLNQQEQKLLDLLNEREQSQLELQESRSQNQRLQQSLKSAINEKEALMREIDRTKFDQQENDILLQQLQLDKATLTKELDEATSHQLKLQEMIDTLRRENRSMQTVDHESEKAALKAGVDSLTRENRDLKQQLLDRDNSHLERELDTAAKTIASLEELIDTLRAEKLNGKRDAELFVKQKEDEYFAKLEQHHELIKTLRKELEQAKNEKEQELGRSRDLQSQINSSKLTEMESRQQSQVIAELQQQLNDLKRANQVQANHITSLTSSATAPENLLRDQRLFFEQKMKEWQEEQVRKLRHEIRQELQREFDTALTLRPPPSSQTSSTVLTRVKELEQEVFLYRHQLESSDQARQQLTKELSAISLERDTLDAQYQLLRAKQAAADRTMNELGRLVQPPNNNNNNNWSSLTHPSANARPSLPTTSNTASPVWSHHPYQPYADVPTRSTANNQPTSTKYPHVRPYD